MSEMSCLSEVMVGCQRQQAIWAKCFHPNGSFIEFRKEEIEQSIPQRFEKIVRQYRDRVAVKSDDHEFSYEKLNRIANEVAHALLGRCENKEEPIALLLETDAPLIAALLGVLKAGKIYVPLDSSLPQNRIAYILNDAQATLLITNTRNLPLARELAQAKLPLINLDELDPSISTENPEISISPDMLTWILYTSGSTGRPKGVVQNHRNVLHFVKNYTNGLHICADDRLTLLFSGSANGAAHDIFSALLNGASLYPFNVKEKSPAAVANWLIQNHLTIYCSVPTVFRHFLETLTGEESFPALRLIKLVGEPVSRRDVELYQQYFSSDCVFINRLGSTETGTIRWYFINKETQINGNIVPVGFPVDENEVLLLDENGDEVRAEAIGEIAVKSRYLTPGYWHKPDVTSAVLLSTAEAERIYRSGDIGRMLPDGCLLCLGRKDSQVKIRGYRVEIAEIEMALLNLGPIKAAVVVAREDRPDNQHLVAYMTAKEEPPPTMTRLRRALAETLPEHMIPSRFVFLDVFPSAPNGKIDRKVLPDPDNCRPALETPYVSARTSIEGQVAHIWANVLALEQVGVYDNFFDLGGHSLVATQVVSRVNQVFQVQLPLRSLFETPTIAGLAERIEEIRGGKDHKAHTFPIVSVSRQKDLPLSFSQQRLWFLDQLMPGSSVYNITEVSRLTGPLNFIALEQSLTEILRRHEVLRTTFRATNGQPFQSIAPAKPFTLTVTDLQHLPEAEREAEARRLATEEAYRPFDLTKGPLFRAALLRLGEQDHVLQCAMHHAVSDGWSLEIFHREMASLYDSFSIGHPSALPELPIQYADFAQWQRQWLQAEVLETLLSYWKKQLAAAPPLLELPTDRPRPAVQTFHGARQSFVLPQSLTESLKGLSRQEGVTLFMTLLAAFKTLLYSQTGQEDIVVGTDVANRTRAETEGLIGFFVNLLALRTDLSRNPSFRELLKRVREVCLAAYTHQDLPFDKLVEVLRPDRSAAHYPLVQVLFVFQNVPKQAFRFADLTLTPFEYDNVPSKFDLAVFLRQKGDGLVFSWVYRIDLFDGPTITGMSERFETLLKSIVAQPDTRLKDLKIISGAERQRQIEEATARRRSSFRRFKKVVPNVIDLSQIGLVKTDCLRPGEALPLLVQPGAEDVDLIAWAKANVESIETELSNHGAILFRGFHVASASEFENFAQALCPELFADYGDLPRTAVGDKVYESTPYPAEQTILFHNESSHLHRWPLKQWFFCIQPATQGGETPIVDCRKVYQLHNLEVINRFEKKQIMYVRNFTDGLGVSWQNFFKTNVKSEVESICANASMDFEWKDNNGLRTRHVCPAVARHPKTDEYVWFNQIQHWHLACLDPATRESLLSLFLEEDLPRNCYYGDGSPIEDSVIEEINEVYRRMAVSFTWQKGDILMLDNMLTAHGRSPYMGPRRIVVAMGEMVHKESIES